MITPEEEAQLVLLEEKEQDFYAGAMFLGMVRVEHYLASMRSCSTVPDASALANIVLGVFEDLNERATRPDVDN